MATCYVSVVWFLGRWNFASSTHQQSVYLNFFIHPVSPFPLYCLPFLIMLRTLHTKKFNLYYLCCKCFLSVLLALNFDYVVFLCNRLYFVSLFEKFKPVKPVPIFLWFLILVTLRETFATTWFSTAFSSHSFKYL